METTPCASTSLHLSATATYLMLMHCKSITCFHEQDAPSQHSAGGGLSVHHALIMLRDALAAEKLVLVLWFTPTSFGFALAALEISKANLIYHAAAERCALSLRNR